MIENLIHGIVLKAKANTGASGEFIGWIFAGVVLSIIAVVFFSLAAFVWLAGLYGGALAGLFVGSVHLAMTFGIVSWSMVVRRRNRQLALAQIELAAKQPGWQLDPGYVAIGVELIKIVGVRKLIPLAAAAGLLAVGWSASHGKATASPPH
jgi:hypothetical protein